MPTDKQVQAVVDVLNAPAWTVAGTTQQEVAEAILAELEALRQRQYKYVVICQDRSRTYERDLKGSMRHERRFNPTWVLGPYFTASEAATAARKARDKHKGTDWVKVMVAQVMEPDAEVDPDGLKEVLY